jgi:thioredoxin-related protein
MRTILRFLRCLAVVALAGSSGQAGLDIDATIPKASNLELVVMEAPGCTYCGIFRRDVLPAYEASERAKDVPIRFLDVNDVSSTKIDLETPVDIVPTFVILKDNKEIGRIPGYVGPETFFHTINYLLSTVP